VLVQTILFARYRHVVLPRWQRRFGDVFLIRIAPRRRPMVLVARPEHIREVFGGDAHVFHGGEGNEILGPLMGPHSLLLLDDEDHARSRRRLLPAFSGTALRGYRQLVAEVATRHVRGWPVGREVEAHRLTRALTLDVICQVVLGVTDQERLEGLLPLVDKVVSAGPLILLSSFYQRLVVLPPWRSNWAAQQRLDRVIHDEIAQRRGDPGLAGRPDVLSRLLHAPGDGFPDAELRDQLVTLLLAGHETTATALAWTMSELARDPALLARAQQAADGADEHYLEAVVMEALRVHPVIYEVARKLTAPARVGGYRVPAGVVVMPAIGLVQSDVRHFADAERFRPERYVGTHPAPNTWIPFGGGDRRCLGAGFALMESVVMLRELLTTYDVHSTRRAENPKARNITLAPAHGARLVLTPRRPRRLPTAVGG
jgi:cytochrome P450